MSFSSRLVSLLLALSIAVITTAFLSLMKDSGFILLFVAFSISFSSSFLLFYFTFEFLIIGEVNRAYSILEKMKKKEFKNLDKTSQPSLNPIKKLNQEIYSYASTKQEEIDQLKKLAIYRREFLADVSHELKTPIFAAQGFIHTLIDGAVDDKSVRDKFLHKAAKSLDGLNDLVEDLFTLSKMEAGMVKMNFEPVNIYQVIKEAFEQLEHKAHKKDISLKFHDDNLSEIFVIADMIRIKQVIINLIENAIKYGNEDGYVEVAINEKGKNIEVQVVDNGRGIPSEHLDRIFERFYRVEKSRSKAKGGSGLGLAIVKHILEIHKSEITVSSKVKVGTVFKFKLKKAEAPSQDQNQGVKKNSSGKSENFIPIS